MEILQEFFAGGEMLESRDVEASGYASLGLLYNTHELKIVVLPISVSCTGTQRLHLKAHIACGCAVYQGLKRLNGKAQYSMKVGEVCSLEKLSLKTDRS